jgi:NADH:ubiquinone oxidoreductase subunit 5 (subunit L)/multisubunit Na+/H+ antiporter MnhA subunit
MIVAIDGEAHSVADAGGGAMLTLTHAPAERSPHQALIAIVGFAWVIGIGFALLIYRNGFQLADRLRRNFLPIRLAHTALKEKLYFDHVYDNLVVMGIRLIGVMAYAFDKIIVDGLVNLTAVFGRFVGSFAGRQLDMPIRKHDVGLVDALVNGIAGVCYDIGSQIRRPQSGRIRTYVMITAGTAAVVLLMVLFFDQIDGGFDAIRRTLFVADK